ncbi:hypothetical protein CspHIS471_0105280 [Cutaneotrichosporon sp. HIS471]|nr:hypothetical protein CspHIS471_0105280 [Cutaneotrichosporon sp. HIS471]
MAPQSRKGPNIFLMLGLFGLSSVTFLIMSERRSKDPRSARKEFPGPRLGDGGVKIDIEPGKKGVWLEKTLATNLTSPTTLKNTITTSNKANRSPIFFRHQCDLDANSDVLSKCLTDLRNGLSFLDKCEKLCVTPALFVNTLSLQTILPHGRESSSKGPIAMWRGPFDIAHRMKNLHADDDLGKTPALVAKTNKLCAQLTPPPPGYETPVDGCKQSRYPDNPKVSLYMNAHNGLCQHRCSGHHTPRARSLNTVRRPLKDGPAKAPVLDSPAIGRLKSVNIDVNKPLPEIGSLHTQLPMDSDRTPAIQDANLAIPTAVMEKSTAKSSVVVRGVHPGWGSIGTPKPTARRHRMSPAPNGSRCPTASQSGSTSPKSECSYTTAAGSIPRSQGGVVAEKDSKLVSEVPWIPSHPISRSSTVRAVVSYNRHLDSRDARAAKVCNMSQVLEDRSGTAMSAPNMSKDVRNSSSPAHLPSIKGYVESSGASCASTLVPDTPWYELPKRFAPLSEGGTTTSSATGKFSDFTYTSGWSSHVGSSNAIPLSTPWTGLKSARLAAASNGTAIDLCRSSSTGSISSVSAVVGVVYEE